MAGLAASLQANPDVEVLRIPANTADLSQALDDLAPAVVAFDLDEMPGDLAISLLRDRPELILIGADPSSDRMLLLSGRQEQPVSAAECAGDHPRCPPNFGRRYSYRHHQQAAKTNRGAMNNPK
jgi:hypothetical protein